MDGGDCSELTVKLTAAYFALTQLIKNLAVVDGIAVLLDSWCDGAFPEIQTSGTEKHFSKSSGRPHILCHPFQDERRE